MHYALLVCHISSDTGIGHLARLEVIAEQLHNDGKVVPELMVFGDNIQRESLKRFTGYYFASLDEFSRKVESTLRKKNHSLVIFDLYPNDIYGDLKTLLMSLKSQGARLISIDALRHYGDILDMVWVPSFMRHDAEPNQLRDVYKSGWDTLLVRKRLATQPWSPRPNVLALTGGGDVTGLSRTLPQKLDSRLPEKTKIHWVRGPYAESPTLPSRPRLNWEVHESPHRLDELMVISNYAITVFGVSFFEAIQYGLPTVVFSPYGLKDQTELTALSQERVAAVAENQTHAVSLLSNLMGNPTLAQEYSFSASEKMSVNGVSNICNHIYLLLGLT